MGIFRRGSKDTIAEPDRAMTSATPEANPEVANPEGSDEAFGLQVGQGIVGWVAKS